MAKRRKVYSKERRRRVRGLRFREKVSGIGGNYGWRADLLIGKQRVVVAAGANVASRTEARRHAAMAVESFDALYPGAAASARKPLPRRRKR